MGVAILASDLDWTLVRTPRVVGRRTDGRARTGQLTLGPWSKVSRGGMSQASCCGALRTTPTSGRRR